MVSLPVRWPKFKTNHMNELSTLTKYGGFWST